MKKLMAILVGILAVVPFIAQAEEEQTTNYFEYGKGQIVNFYGNADAENAKAGGIESIIFDDKGTEAEFVEAWLLGTTTGYSMSNNLFSRAFRQTDAYNQLITNLTSLNYIPAVDAEKYDYIYKPDDAEKGFRLATIQDMIDVFGAVKTEGQNEYTFPKLTEDTLLDRNGNKQSLLDEFNRVFDKIGALSLEGTKNGILLSDRIEDEKFWVVKFEFDAEEKITDAKVVAIDFSTSDNNMYAIIPVVYVNKTADCHEVKQYCYICNGEYKFAVEGTQGEGCEIKAGIDKAEDCAKTVCYKCATTVADKFEFKKGKVGQAEFSTCEVVPDAECVPKTGKKSYILEFAIVAALCTISLLVVKRKELFKTM